MPTYTEVGSNYQSSTGSKKKPSTPVDYRIVTLVIVTFDVSFVFRLRLALALLLYLLRRFTLSREHVFLTGDTYLLSFAFILRILGVVDRNLWKLLSCIFYEFLNNTTNVIYGSQNLHRETPLDYFTRAARCTRMRGTNAKDPGAPGATEESHKAKANVPNAYNLGSSASELRTGLDSRILNPSTYYYLPYWNTYKYGYTLSFPPTAYRCY